MPVDPCSESVQLNPHAFPLPASLGEVTVPHAVRALAQRPGLIVLDSAGGAPRRWSLIGFDPLVDFEMDPVEAPKTLADLEVVLSRFEIAGDLESGCGALDASAERLARSPFLGGFLGALSYDLGVQGQALDLPRAHWPQPPIVGGIYGDWLLFEHGVTGSCVTLYLSDSESGDSLATRRDQIFAAFEESILAQPESDGLGEMRGRSAALRTVSSEEHQRRVNCVRELIADGEIYQANLSHRMEAETEADALSLYLRLREVNAAPYMGFCRFHLPGSERGAIVSASPELLLELAPRSSGGEARVARTRPIKGTIGRGATPHEDAALQQELMASAKDRAELAMIVDLERNDLGRIAEPGGVHVREFPALETYASVHHLVADVSARVRPELSAIDVLASVFPGGSITGAPKLRSMEVIAEQECEGRGFFTGALGMIDLRGAALFNILIRTMIHREDTDGSRRVSFHVGGGITWNSDAASEDLETLLKAEGLLRAL